MNVKYFEINLKIIRGNTVPVMIRVTFVYIETINKPL